jgi:hypothetical protein
MDENSVRDSRERIIHGHHDTSDHCHRVAHCWWRWLVRQGPLVLETRRRPSASGVDWTGGGVVEEGVSGTVAVVVPSDNPAIVVDTIRISISGTSKIERT